MSIHGKQYVLMEGGMKEEAKDNLEVECIPLNSQTHKP